MQHSKSRSSRRTACGVVIAFCGACNAILDNHARELEVIAPGIGGTAMASAGAGGDGLGASENGASEAGASGAAGSSNESSEGGAAGSENEPANRGGSATGGTAGVNHGGTSQGGTSQGGKPACTGCTPGVTEPQTRACGICNAGKESGTRLCTPSCTWETIWSGACSDHGTAANGCSFVKWCKNDDGRPECSLVGCLSKDAEAECREEAQSVCGTVKNLLINTQCP